MQGIPEAIRFEIEEAIRRPRGTFTFDYTSDQLFNPEIEGGIIFQIVAGGHIFRLERDNNFHLNFYHSSPGTGTRKAAIHLSEVTPAETVFLAFTWDPSEISLSIGPRIDNGKHHNTKGFLSKKQLRVGSDGSVYEIGDSGVSVIGARVYAGGRAVILPTALDSWVEVLQSAQVILDAIEPEDYLNEVVRSNSILTMLVTGFENYGKRRMMELEKEGISPDFGNLFDTIFSTFHVDRGLPDIIAGEAERKGVSIIENIVYSRHINFQSYDETKRAFKSAYGIRFGDLDVTSQELERLQKLISYRHSIVHVSPLLSFLNQENVPPEEPEFSNSALAKDAINLFSKFMKAFHEATLELDRID